MVSHPQWSHRGEAISSSGQCASLQCLGYLDSYGRNTESILKESLEGVSFRFSSDGKENEAPSNFLLLFVNFVNYKIIKEEPSLNPYIFIGEEVA